MRICDLTNLFIEGGEGGVNTYLTEKSRYRADVEPGVEHHLVIPGRRTESREFGASTLHAISSPRYLRNPQHRVILNRRVLRRVLRDIAPDVIEVDCASLLGKIASDAFNGVRPVIVGFYHVHLPTFFARDAAKAFGDGIASIVENFAWRLVRRFVAPCDRVVVTSDDIRERLEARGFTDLEHIPLGVNTRLFRPGGNGVTAAASDAARHEPTVLYVGRLSREKHLHVLFEAYEKLRRREKAATLRIVGDGPLRGLVEERARKTATIRYDGLCHYGEELAEIYREADVVVVPSPSETFGLTLLESLSSGVPVVAVRRGGPSRLVRPEVGALAEPDDATDLAAKIDSVLDARLPAAASRDFVLREYSWERTFGRLFELYRSLRQQRDAQHLAQRAGRVATDG